MRINPWSRPQGLSLSQGFTLIEVLIALTLFAIVATLTSSSIYYAFNARTRLNNQSQKLLSLQLALSLVQRDTEQSLVRAVRGDEMRLFEPFIGQATYVEFTRGGIPNPQNANKRSTLERIAYICRDNQLLRKTWTSLDVIKRTSFEEKVLLQDLSKCQFKFLNNHLQVLNEWQESAGAVTPKNEIFPKALQLVLEFPNWGNGSFLFPIPSTLYAKT